MDSNPDIINNSLSIGNPLSLFNSSASWCTSRWLQMRRHLWLSVLSRVQHWICVYLSCWFLGRWRVRHCSLSRRCFRSCPAGRRGAACSLVAFVLVGWRITWLRFLLCCCFCSHVVSVIFCSRCWNSSCIRPSSWCLLLGARCLLFSLCCAGFECLADATGCFAMFDIIVQLSAEKSGAAHFVHFWKYPSTFHVYAALPASSLAEQNLPLKMQKAHCWTSLLMNRSRFHLCCWYQL